jgi:hypothetical protein
LPFGFESSIQPEDHRIINRLAAEKLPAAVPELLRTRAPIEEIEYLGPEPDRWRSPNEAELNAAQAPEHYIDLELADMARARRSRGALRRSNWRREQASSPTSS